jgi:hypothetical protein
MPKIWRSSKFLRMSAGADLQHSARHTFLYRLLGTLHLQHFFRKPWKYRTYFSIFPQYVCRNHCFPRDHGKAFFTEGFISCSSDAYLKILIVFLLLYGHFYSNVFQLVLFLQRNSFPARLTDCNFTLCAISSIIYNPPL